MGGTHPSVGIVSGSRTPPIIDLVGNSMAGLAHTIPTIAERTGRRVIVIGGMAVLCRLTHPYRATSDIETVNRRGSRERPQLELLLASGAEASGPSGALVPTSTGAVQVDVLEVTDDRRTRISARRSGRPAPCSGPRVGGRDRQSDDPSSRPFEQVTVAMAEPGPLIAMKLQSVMNRRRAKEATDLLDIVQLSLDRATGPASRSALAEAHPTLRHDALLHSRLWFDDRVDRTLRLVRSAPEGRDTRLDDLHLVGELLRGALSSP